LFWITGKIRKGALAKYDAGAAEAIFEDSTEPRSLIALFQRDTPKASDNIIMLYLERGKRDALVPFGCSRVSAGRTGILGFPLVLPEFKMILQHAWCFSLAMGYCVGFVKTS